MAGLGLRQPAVLLLVLVLGTGVGVATAQSSGQLLTIRDPAGLLLRLAEGNTTGPDWMYGRLEVSQDDVNWGTVCDDFFNKSSARVACRAFGFSDGESVARAHHGQGQGDILLDNVECRGSERSLLNCSSNAWGRNDCEHGEDVGVVCFNDFRSAFRMRLRDGEMGARQVSGRLEVSLPGMDWGSVCDDVFSHNAAAVACKYFHFRFGEAHPEAAFGRGTRTYMDEVRCRGTEASLLDCSHQSWKTHDCSNEEDVGVVCFNATARLRSRSRELDSVGVVDLWEEGQGWRPVCDQGWTDMDARVACRELGFQDGKAETRASLSPESGRTSVRRRVYQNINCTGEESGLLQCGRETRSSCLPGRYAYVLCYNVSITEVDMRLAVRLAGDEGQQPSGGQVRSWGRVELRYHGVWGQVCSHSWTDKEAAVVCRSQGFAGGKAFGDVSESGLPFWYREITCQGNESSLAQCRMGLWGESESVCQPAHVLCYRNNVTVSLARVGGGSYGRVEVTYDGERGTVCGEGWGDEEARVVCRALGYRDGLAMQANVPPGSGPVFLSNVRCLSDDVSLIRCMSNGWRNVSAACSSHTRDAGVRCFNNVRLMPGTEAVGVVQVYDNNAWSSLCGTTGFSDVDASVVCRELGFLHGVSLPTGVFGFHTGPHKRSNISCTGNESSILECPYDQSSWSCFPYSSAYASVACYNTTSSSNETLRLDGGVRSPGERSGVVRVRQFHTWGYVCDRFWDNTAASVLCRQLGFRGGIAYRYESDSPGPFLLTELRCQGNESSLLDCSQGEEVCDTRQAAGVLCYRDAAPGVQLREGGTQYGRLQAVINNQAGRICGHMWGDEDAMVACQMLGFNHGKALKYPASRLPVYLSQVRCRGVESSLFQCPNLGWRQGQSDCTLEHGDAGVYCFQSVRIRAGNVTQDVAEGRLSAFDAERGAWLPVCMSGFDHVDAGVACRAMGFDSAAILASQRPDYNPRYITQLACDGSESNLTSCTHSQDYCRSTAGDASVYCYRSSAGLGVRYFLEGGYHGRVLVEQYGKNGTICEKDWDDRDADVLCKQLRFTGGVALGTKSGRGYDLVWMARVNCTGVEARLEDCDHVGNAEVSTSCRASSLSAGALCYRKASGVGVRLVGGARHFGRVEVSYEGTWGTVCDYAWTRFDAMVLCRQLGFVEGMAYSRSHYGKGSAGQPVFMDELRCRSDDLTLLSCPNRGWNNSARYCQEHDNDAGAYCYPPVRLAPAPDYGGVEVWHDNDYGLVCADNFTERDATVVCRELGYRWGKPLCCGAFGRLNKDLHYGDFQCQGNEPSLLNCSRDLLAPCPSHSYASIVCANSTESTQAYSVSLQNGSYGLVEIRHMDHAGFLCPDGLTDQDAAVLCREAGFQHGGIAFRRDRQRRGDYIRDIRWMGQLSCTGNEQQIRNCPNFRWGNLRGCTSDSDAGAMCFTSPPSQPPWSLRLQDGSLTEGRVEIKLNDTWGTVCGLMLDDNVAAVLCRGLGFPTGVLAGYTVSTSSTAPVWIKKARCLGNETSIFQCALPGLNDFEPTCDTHRFDARIQCHSDVRLSGAPTGQHQYGRVEVDVGNASQPRWLAVCDQGFSNTEATVLCRQFGFPVGKQQCCSALGHMDPSQLGVSRLACQGQERKLNDCARTLGSCSSQDYVTVFCSNSTSDGVSVSLPPNIYSGRVEVTRFGIKGTICDQNFTNTEAKVICKELGQNEGLAVRGPRSGKLPVLMGGLRCHGNESFVSECRYDDFSDNHGCAETRGAASVLCLDSINGVQTRLLPEGGERGVAQVLLNDNWGYISNLDFSRREASVFCRTLGFVGGDVLWSGTSPPLQGTILMSEVKCKGNESSLLECQATYDPNSNQYIPTSMAVSVVCNRAVKLERGNFRSNGIVKVFQDGEWGTVCNDSFEDEDATVVCRELGHEAGKALCCSPYGYTFDVPLVANVSCKGSEGSIVHCPYTARRSPSSSSSSRSSSRLCNRQDYAAVACYNGSADTQNMTLSLVGGSSYTGEVAVRYLGVSGRICSDNWDDKDAHVVCRQLGFQDGQAYNHYRSTFAYFDYSGPYWASNLGCFGNESALRECPQTDIGNVKVCKNEHYAGALCFNADGLFYRLGGGGANYGRVEVAVDGRWGTVCDRYWDQREASVLCRKLGFSDGDPRYGGYSDSAASLPVWQTNLRCTGRESDLNHCAHEGWTPAASASTCGSHSRDAGVHCYTGAKLSTGIGTETRHGAVLLHSLWPNTRDRWFRVCDQNFDDQAAKVVCRSLGFVDGRAICCSAYGAIQDSSKLLSNVTLVCSGEESNITQCVRHAPCNSSYYASVACIPKNGTVDDSSYNFTLPRPTTGEVAVRHLGVAGRICARGWDDQDARVLCRSLGHRGGVAYQHSYVGTITSERARGPFWLSQMGCSGQEQALEECPHSDRLALGNCSREHSAGALCFNDTTELQYRLVGGGPTSGRVEIAVGGVWGTVCDTYWDDKDATVFCRQFNYSSGVALPGARYGQGRGPIWLSHLQCRGSESSLHQCPHRGFRDEVSQSVFLPFLRSCTSHSDDASVFCYKNARLNQKLGSARGGLELWQDGQWQGVCDSGMDLTAAVVACRSLGQNFTQGRLVRGSAFGNLSGPIGVASVRCQGDEEDISQCQIQRGDCPSGHYVSIYCASKPFDETGFAVRLGDDSLSGAMNGILEVRMGGVWGRVCMRGWSDNNAAVACRQLGFKGGVAYLHIVKNSRAMLMRDVNCTGLESSMDTCPYVSTETSPDLDSCAFDSHDAGVICFNSTGVEYRLQGGADPSSGRVEIGYDGRWATICSWAWNSRNSGVLCRQLGFQDGIPSRERNESLPALRPDVSGVFCSGTERSLLTCLNSGFRANLLSYLCTGDAYTNCFNKTVEVTQMRLVNTVTPSDTSRGRVEVFVAGPDQWGTVCDDYWDAADAGVVCRALGFQDGRALNSSVHVGKSGPIWLDNLECHGNESNLGQCKHRGIGTHNCYHSEDAAVECFNVNQTTPVIVPTALPSTASTTQIATTTTSATVTPSTTTPTTTPTTTTPTTTTPTTTTPTTTTPTTTPRATPPPKVTTSAPASSTPQGAGTSTEGGSPAASVSQGSAGRVAAIVVPVLLLLLVAAAVAALVVWRLRRGPKSNIAHERFHDDIIERTHDGSIAMSNQLYDQALANGDTADPMSESTKYVGENAEVMLQDGGLVHFSSKQGQPEENGGGGFSNPLYGSTPGGEQQQQPGSGGGSLKLDMHHHNGTET